MRAESAANKRVGSLDELDLPEREREHIEHVMRVAREIGATRCTFKSPDGEVLYREGPDPAPGQDVDVRVLMGRTERNRRKRIRRERRGR